MDVERWNEEARQARRIDMVRICSGNDFFHKDADAWRAEAWELIRRCDNLHFQVLTKRPLLIRERLPPDWGTGYGNVWLGVSIESNDYVWRADVLREIPARIRWISAEPLLGPLPHLDLTGFQWLVVGGESGPGHRDMNHAWARQLRDMAKGQGVAFFFKQSSGARAGQGDLLDGREWKEYPVVPPDPQPTHNPNAELVPREEEVRQAEEEAAREQERESHRQEEEAAHERQLERDRHEADRRFWETHIRFNQQFQEEQDDARNATASAEERKRRSEERGKTFERLMDDMVRATEAEVAWRESVLRRFNQPSYGQSVVRQQQVSLAPHLAVLGLKWPTTEDAVKAAYRELVKKHHPDRDGNPDDFKKVQAAYDCVMKALNESGVR
jgi:protein gp37